MNRQAMAQVYPNYPECALALGQQLIGILLVLFPVDGATTRGSSRDKSSASASRDEVSRPIARLERVQGVHGAGGVDVAAKAFMSTGTASLAPGLLSPSQQPTPRPRQCTPAGHRR